MLGHLITLGVLLGAGGIAFGMLRQTVKQIPAQTRLEMKIAIRDGIDAHVAQYAHKEREITGVRPVPTEMQG